MTSSTRTLLLLGLLTLMAAPVRAEEEASKLYDLTTKGPDKVAKGAKGSLTITITAKGDGQLHSDTPYKLSLTAPKNVGLTKDKLTSADIKLEGHTATFDVPFTANEAGAGNVEGKLSFFVCTEKMCSRQERTVSIPVSVQ